MLRRISVENFKGIGPRINIDLKPVTLLFGPNSAGKSTVLHAVHYAHAVLELGDPEVGQIRLGGDIDLGGFHAFVHDHDLDAAVTVAFEFQPESEGALANAARQLKREFGSVGVELRVRWSSFLRRPIVERYAVAVESEPLAELGCSLDGANVWLTNINLANPVLGVDLDGNAPKVLTERVGCLPDRRMALPIFGSPLSIEGHQDEVPLYDLLEDLVVSAGESLRDQLSRFRYVGPLRHAPPRHYQPPTRADEARWARGLGAWDVLIRDDALRAEASEWLGHETRLSTGYSIGWHRYRELDETSLIRMRAAAQNLELDETFLRLTAALPERGRLVIIDIEKQLELAPCDVGEGIAQVVPIVAAALARAMVTTSGDEDTVELVAIEQPELHIHPRMQVVLGDLFLSQCTDRQFLIETHSEHLMLRLLRRIRQTSQGELPPEAQPATIDTVGVLYVEQVSGAVTITNLRISEDGEFLDPWPDGFFDERFPEVY